MGSRCLTAPRRRIESPLLSRRGFFFERGPRLFGVLAFLVFAILEDEIEKAINKEVKT
jgi:hypothetical protein